MDKRISQGTTGSHSPAVARDQVTNYGTDAYVIDSMRREVRDLSDEANQLRHEIGASRQREHRDRRYLKVLLSISLAALIALAFAVMRLSDQDDSKPVSAPTVTRTVQTLKTVQVEQPGPAASAVVSWPHRQALPCGAGRWITVLKSSGPTDNTGELLAAVQRYSDRTGQKPPLKYDYPKADACGTVRKGFWILYLGPFDSVTTAVGECNRLGWSTAADNEHCFALAMDSAVPKGQRHVRPDGVVS